MYYNIPPYSEIRAYIAPERKEFTIDNECYVNLYKLYDTNCLDMGGYPFRTSNASIPPTVSGTAQSGTVSQHQNIAFNFMPRDGAIPIVEISMSYINDFYSLAQQTK